MRKRKTDERALRIQGIRSSVPEMNNPRVTQNEDRNKVEEEAAEVKKRHFPDSVGCGHQSIRLRATSEKTHPSERFEAPYHRVQFAGPFMLST